MTMCATQLRSLFRQFAGFECYIKFIRTIHRSNDRTRLRFWQERIWNQFIAENTFAPRTAQEMVSLFSVCYVHDVPTVDWNASPPIPPIRLTPEYETAEFNLFPFAKDNNQSCQECREARWKWINENAELCRILRCRTTYEAYCARFLTELADEPCMREKISTCSSEIAALMTPGDELWEWD